MKYAIEVYKSRSSAGCTITYVFDSVAEIKKRIEELKDYESILSIKEFHLVYQHPISLPKHDEVNAFLNKEIYHKMVTVPKEKIKPALQKEYKDNFIEEAPFFHYCIEYDYLDKDTLFDVIYKGSGTYDLKNSDRKAIMKSLYEHTKSNQYFNVSLYQYRYYTKEEFLSL